MKTMATHEGKTCKPQRIPLSAKLTATQIQNAYDEIADQYEKKTWFDQHILGVARLKKNLLSKANGKILEVACGIGSNIPLLPVGSDITAVDLSPRMLEVARKTATQNELSVNFAVMDAEHLEFPDATFDTVVSTLSTCTFPNPVKALQEIKRICRPNGLILLLEHGHSSMPWLARYQDRHEYQHYEDHAGCRWNQDPLELIQSAGIKIVKSKRNILGMFHSIEAVPV
ncbi:MAG TPA: class I SAM-dependent methyltransferase [Anaerolineales bacterium]|nr:class I SAM-dependent methyltransferase [Anaerolineales bacterium]HRJ58757.1 class I SAM-dependent methyltransferase [Anaerolineales bacterium]HRK89174.1 class I SAM-dependent methyltransferase [Anaerolineales bacterium]